MQADIRAYQAGKAKIENVAVKDTRIFSKGLTFLSVVCLLIIAALALKTMFGSPDIEAYNINKDLFHNVGFVCTIGYFVFAYWALRREKNLNNLTINTEKDENINSVESGELKHYASQR